MHATTEREVPESAAGGTVGGRKELDGAKPAPNCPSNRARPEERVAEASELGVRLGRSGGEGRGHAR